MDARGAKFAALRVVAEEMTVVRSRGNVNAFGLADECIREWERLLVAHGLLLPE